MPDDTNAAVLPAKNYGQLDFIEMAASDSKTEIIIKQGEFQALKGLWVINGVDEAAAPEQKPADEFFLGILLGSALILERCAMAEDQYQNRRCEFYGDDPACC